MFNVPLLQGKSVSLTNFFRIARNTMTMCFNKEPGAAEVEVSMLTSLFNNVYISSLPDDDYVPFYVTQFVNSGTTYTLPHAFFHSECIFISCSKSSGGLWSRETAMQRCIVGRWTPVHMAVDSPQESQSHFQSK